jgi:ADP-ribose pyrophosphatase YjhB (NUDIX family)
MLAQGSGLTSAVIVGLPDKETGYATPKVGLRGAVFRERSDGKWTLPGGWADISASPAENVILEICAESGFLNVVSKLLAIYDRSRYPHDPLLALHAYKIFRLCTIIGGQATISSETDSLSLFEESEIPELSITRVTPARIHRMFEHHRNRALPTDFDRPL